jgi:uncharacterized protein (DUF983 family)
MNFSAGLTTSVSNQSFIHLASAGNPSFYSLLLSIFLGFVIGSLINYLADVLPATRRLSQPVCPECGQPYLIRDYLFSLRCPHCGHKRTKRHLIVLITSVILCVLLRFFPFHGLSFWSTIPLLIYLGVIVVIDLEHRLVLVETSLFGFMLMLIYGVTFHGFLNALSGALGGMLIMLILFLLGGAFGKIVGILRHKAVNEVPFGFGDVVFGTILGLLCGWPAIAAGLLLGILTFSAYSILWLISLVLTKRYKSFSNAQALTPFLIMGSIILFYLK